MSIYRIFKSIFLSSKAKYFRVSAANPIADRGGIAVIAIAKNEERYIADWATHHLACGAHHIYLYDNGSTDGTVQEIQRIRTKNITVIPWNNRFFDAEIDRPLQTQVLAYAHAVANFGGLYRWMTFIDIDEMLIPKKANTLLDALAHLEAFSYVSLPWHMFGPCGHTVPQHGPVAANYRFRARNPMHPELCKFKYIVDPVQVDIPQVHRCKTLNQGYHTVNDRGELSADRDRMKE